jgi:23S rRNA (cytidine2498-2'-O)-methyltransferase
MPLGPGQVPYLVALAPPGLERSLERELSSKGLKAEWHGRLAIVLTGDSTGDRSGQENRNHNRNDSRETCGGAEPPLWWAQNVWLNPKLEVFTSVRQATEILRSVQRNWWCHPVGHYRRCALITESLPSIKRRQWAPYEVLPTLPLGSWTLVDKNTLLYSASCVSAFPDGELEFKENKTEPPSRAYLKLWEALTLVAKRPSPKDRVIDLGSSPGGWTWALAQIAGEVVSVDKAPLTEELLGRKNVRFLQESAFALRPEDIGPVDWWFCDVICYPDRLLELIKKWSPFCKRMVASIKFQGDNDVEPLSAFAGIPGARVFHLSHNKHELTFYRE